MILYFKKDNASYREQEFSAQVISAKHVYCILVKSTNCQYLDLETKNENIKVLYFLELRRQSKNIEEDLKMKAILKMKRALMVTNTSKAISILKTTVYRHAKTREPGNLVPGYFWGEIRTFFRNQRF